MRFFFSFESGTLFRLLFWGNFSFALLVFGYMSSPLERTDRARPLILLVSRIFLAAGWGISVLIGFAPAFVFLNFGLSALFVGFFLESLLLLKMSLSAAKRDYAIQTVLFILVLCAVNLFPAAHVEPRFKMFVISCSLFSCFLWPGLLFMFSASGSLLKKVLGAMYVSFVAVSFIQAALVVDEFTGRIISPYYLGNLYNLLFFLQMNISGAGFLLLMKEDADKRIAELAYRDPLTGVFNRRHFMEQARVLLASHARSGAALAVLFVDIDHFKKVNDVYGHHFGDAVLHDFSSVLKMHLRTSDLLCRYGGEEFVLLLTNTDQDGAHTVAVNLQRYLRESRFPENPAFSYTVSVGVACRVPESGTVDALQQMIRDSDAALYRAKETGRDRVVFFGDF